MDRKRIVVGVSGGIAAYKACTVVRQLAEAGRLTVSLSGTWSGSLGP